MTLMRLETPERPRTPVGLAPAPVPYIITSQGGQ